MLPYCVSISIVVPLHCELHRRRVRRMEGLSAYLRARGPGVLERVLHGLLLLQLVVVHHRRRAGSLHTIVLLQELQRNVQEEK